MWCRSTRLKPRSKTKRWKRLEKIWYVRKVAWTSDADLKQTKNTHNDDISTSSTGAGEYVAPDYVTDFFTEHPGGDNYQITSDSSSSSPSSFSASSIAQSPSPELDPTLDPFETAIDNFALVNGMSNAPITLDVYDKLLSELLAVFKKSDGTFTPFGWDIY